jgi:hypothetical protein
MLRSTRSNSSSRMLRKQNNQCLSSGPATTAAPWQENKEVLRSLHGSRKRKRKASARGGGGGGAAAADEEKGQTKRQRLRVGGSTARRQRQARELRVSNEVPNKGDLETQVPGILWPSDQLTGPGGPIAVQILELGQSCSTVRGSQIPGPINILRPRARPRTVPTLKPKRLRTW